MQNPDNFLKEEWEAVLLAGVILLIVVCLGFSFAKKPRQRNFHTDSPTGARYQPFLDKDSFAFLNQKTDIQLPRNPFQSQIRIAIPKAKQSPPVETKLPEKSADVQPTPETPAIPVEMVEQPEPVVQQPVFRLMRKRLTYLYSQADNTGKTSAVVKISGSDGKEELLTPGSGEKLLGMTVLSIGTERLSLLDASGNQVNVPFGEAKTVIVREKQ